ncbi:S14 domain and spectrin repeat-containing protein 1, partial [Ameca splendens]
MEVVVMEIYTRSHRSLRLVNVGHCVAGSGWNESSRAEMCWAEPCCRGTAGTQTKMSGVTMEASSILPILKKKLAFLSGGKDRRSGLILTIPLNSDQTSMEELSATLDYLLSIPSDKCKARGFTVIVDGRRSQWNIVKTVVLMLQNVIPAEVSLVCVVKPDEFWDKKVTHFCFWKEKDRLGFE